ncbi:DUF4124 domain-containing protein [Undibacterium sp. Di26W]|uniref:DUF4124 domain-containing protein n=1 Tax=Undibacterium sp. Di26W TaxID=3413035 RepID=UPI003BF3458E
MKNVHLVSATILLAMSNMASAQIQRCVDNDGRVTFTDNVCAKSSVKQKSVRADQKMVGSGTETGKDTNLAAQNEAFNQRHAQRELRADNERAVHNFINTPLPPGVKYQRLTTYNDKPATLDSK